MPAFATRGGARPKGQVLGDRLCSTVNKQAGSGFPLMLRGAALCSIESERRCAMSSVSHPPAGTAREDSWVSLLRLKEVWASLAITAMWIAVAVTAVWGSDLVGSSNDGNSTTIPSGIFVGLFASIGTWALAKYALGRTRGQ